MTDFIFQPTRESFSDLSDFILGWGGDLNEEPEPFAAELASLSPAFRAIMAVMIAQSGDWYRVSFTSDAQAVAFRLTFSDRLLMWRA